jgi:hypothetical protein
MTDIPTRIPGFFERRWDSETNTDVLRCVECREYMEFAGNTLPPVGALLTCSGCGLNSKVPALQSQAGLPDASRPPTDDRS